MEADSNNQYLLRISIVSYLNISNWSCDHRKRL